MSVNYSEKEKFSQEAEVSVTHLIIYFVFVVYLFWIAQHVGSVLLVIISPFVARSMGSNHRAAREVPDHPYTTLCRTIRKNKCPKLRKDSQAMVNGLTGWAGNWEENGGN